MSTRSEKTEATPAASEPASEPARWPEEIQAEIEATRAELGETVEALAGKADVKGQAQRKVEETKRQAQANLSGRPTPGRDAHREENPLPRDRRGHNRAGGDRLAAPPAPLGDRWARSCSLR